MEHPTKNSPHIIDNINSVPIEWLMWLKHTRRDAPSKMLSEAIEKERLEREKRAEEVDRRNSVQNSQVRHQKQYQRGPSGSIPPQHTQILQQQADIESSPSQEEIAKITAQLNDKLAEFEANDAERIK